jgi:hypothetical protein
MDMLSSTFVIFYAHIIYLDNTIFVDYWYLCGKEKIYYLRGVI